MENYKQMDNEWIMNSFKYFLNHFISMNEKEHKDEKYTINCALTKQN